MMSHAKLLCLILTGMVVLSSSVAPATGKERSYVSGNSSLTLDGKNCGFVKSAEGGAITAEVINEPAGPNYFVKKRIGQPKYEDFTVKVGFSMAKPVYDWIQQSWTMNRPRKNGSLIATDYSLQAQSERQFFNALITETTIPAMDGTSKEPSYITLRLSPEYTRIEKAGGKVDPGESGKTEPKMFLPANFILEIDGLDCTKVARVEPFTVKQTVATDDIGNARDTAKKPGKLEFPNLTITVAEAAAQPFLDWHEDFIIKGNNDDGREKNGSLTLLSPNRQTVLARIKFFNMGIFRAQPDKAEANADQIRRLTVEMYVERMEFEYAPTATEAAPAPAKPPATAPSPSPLRRG